MLKQRPKSTARRQAFRLGIKSCFSLTARIAKPAIFERVRAWRQRAYASDAGVRKDYLVKPDRPESADHFLPDLQRRQYLESGRYAGYFRLSRQPVAAQTAGTDGG